MSKTTGIAATLIGPEMRHDGLSLSDLAQATAGAIYYVNDSIGEVGLIHSCPCGCGSQSLIYLVDRRGDGRQLWTNSGTREQPTLVPSVGIKGGKYSDREADGYHWHGWLKNGVWESC